MLNLYSISTKKISSNIKLSESEKASVLYHDLFDYPLSFSDLIKWDAGKKYQISNIKYQIAHKRGFYFLEGKEGLIYKKVLRTRVSAKKMKLAKSASRILSFLPGVRMVAVTGSLAMENSSEDSDIDLMIITKRGTLWTTRLFAYIAISAFGLSARKPNDFRQKDKLCLNMWLDESDLIWKRADRNVYTAHEIAQIVPLVNKNKTYERFLDSNKWILGFWQNAVRVRGTKYKESVSLRGHSKNILSTVHNVLISWLESVAYKFQYKYMKSKITREKITKTRALFHPQDWGKVILSRLSS